MTKQHQSYEDALTELGNRALDDLKSALNALPGNRFVLDEPVTLHIDTCDGSGLLHELEARTVLLIGGTPVILADGFDEDRLKNDDAWLYIEPSEAWTCGGEWYAEWEGLLQVVDRVAECAPQKADSRLRKVCRESADNDSGLRKVRRELVGRIAACLNKAGLDSLSLMDYDLTDSPVVLVRSHYDGDIYTLDGLNLRPDGTISVDASSDSGDISLGQCEVGTDALEQIADYLEDCIDEVIDHREDSAEPED